MIDDNHHYRTTQPTNKSDTTPEKAPTLACHTTKSLTSKLSPYCFQRFIEGQRKFVQDKSLNLSLLRRSVDEITLGELRQIPSISPHSRQIVHYEKKVPAYQRLCNMTIHNCNNNPAPQQSPKLSKPIGAPSCYYSKRARTPQKESSSIFSVTPSISDLKSKFLKEVKEVMQNISGDSGISRAECMEILDRLGIISNTAEEKELRENLYFRLSLCSNKNVCDVLFSIIYNLPIYNNEEITAEEVHSLHRNLCLCY